MQSFGAKGREAPARLHPPKRTTLRRSTLGMVQGSVTLGAGRLGRKSLYLIGLLPKPAGQSVTLVSGELNHARHCALLVTQPAFIHGLPSSRSVARTFDTSATLLRGLRCWKRLCRAPSTGHLISKCELLTM